MVDKEIKYEDVIIDLDSIYYKLEDVVYSKRGLYKG